MYDNYDAPESDDFAGADDGFPAGVVDIISDASTELETQATPDLEYDEAVALNETIKSTAEVFHVLVYKAFTGRIWIPLGYNSFTEYVNEELNMSRSRAYQLIDQAKVIEKIAQIAPEGTDVHIKEVVARDLKKVIDNLIPEIERGLEELPDGEDAGAYIAATLEEAREAKRVADSLDAGATGEFEDGGSYDEELAGDYADRQGFSDSSFGGNGGAGSGFGNGDVYSSTVDDILGDDNDDDDIESLFSTDNNAESVARIETLYNFYVIFDKLKTMPSPAEIIAWLPVEKRAQITASFDNLYSWLSEFGQTLTSQEWYEGIKNALNEEPAESSSEEDFFAGFDDEEDGSINFG